MWVLLNSKFLPYVPPPTKHHLLGVGWGMITGRAGRYCRLGIRSKVSDMSAPGRLAWIEKGEARLSLVQNHFVTIHFSLFNAYNRKTRGFCEDFQQAGISFILVVFESLEGVSGGWDREDASQCHGQKVRTGGEGQQMVLQPSIYPADEEQLSHPQQQDSLLPRVMSWWQSV